MEQYKYMTAKIGTEKVTRCKYAYVDIMGNQFITFGRTLAHCRAKRDEWKQNSK